jgi:cytochrome c-type biogenesis protein
MDRAAFAITEALTSSPLVALSAAVVWGMFSVLLSPCHLGTIPLIVGMAGGSPDAASRRAAAISFSFAGGMFAAIVVLGALVSWAGFAVAGMGAVTNYVLAAIFLAAGLHLTELFVFPLPSMSPTAGKRTGMGAAASMGFIFGLGLSPCTFAFLAPILGMTFSGGASGPWRGMALLAAFGVGHCGIIGAAGSSGELVRRYLVWNQHSGAAGMLRTACGVLVILAAGLLVYTA